MIIADAVREARAQIAHAAQQAEERRRAEEAEQSSPMRTPEERVRLWEKRHQLALPRTAEHPLNRVIASQTALTVAEVAGEAARRHLAKTQKAAAGIDPTAPSIAR